MRVGVGVAVWGLRRVRLRVSVCDVDVLLTGNESVRTWRQFGHVAGTGCVAPCVKTLIDCGAVTTTTPFHSYITIYSYITRMQSTANLNRLVHSATTSRPLHWACPKGIEYPIVRVRLAG